MLCICSLTLKTLRNDDFYRVIHFVAGIDMATFIVAVVLSKRTIRLCALPNQCVKNRLGAKIVCPCCGRKIAMVEIMRGN